VAVTKVGKSDKVCAGDCRALPSGMRLVASGVRIVGSSALIPASGSTSSAIAKITLKS
jgi:hypothetical protein